MTISPSILAICVALFWVCPHQAYRKAFAMSECKQYVPIIPQIKLVCSLSATVSSHISAKTRLDSVVFCTSSGQSWTPQFSMLQSILGAEAPSKDYVPKTCPYLQSNPKFDLIVNTPITIQSHVHNIGHLPPVSLTLHLIILFDLVLNHLPSLDLVY